MCWALLFDQVWNYKLRRCLFTLLGHLDYIRTTFFHHVSYCDTANSCTVTDFWDTVWQRLGILSAAQKLYLNLNSYDYFFFCRSILGFWVPQMTRLFASGTGSPGPVSGMIHWNLNQEAQFNNLCFIYAEEWNKISFTLNAQLKCLYFIYTKEWNSVSFTDT